MDPTKLSIVDTGVQVWLWIGSKAKPKDKEIGIEVAMEYVAKIPDARPKLKVQKQDKEKRKIGLKKNSRKRLKKKLNRFFISVFLIVV